MSLQAIRSSSSDATLHKMWHQIFIERPQIEGFLSRNGAKTLAEYSHSVIASPSRIHPAASSIVAGLARKHFGEELAKKVSDSLSVIGSIDTSSHGGIFSEDTLVQSQMVLASGVKQFNATVHTAFACGVVPMNNATWPRGFFRDGKRESIIPKSFDRIAVHECTPFTNEMIQKRLADKGIDSCTRGILERIQGVPNIFEQERFSDQATLVNYALWKEACHVTGIDEFVHLLLEDVTAALLIYAIENDEAISELIFCEPHRPLFIETLASLPGTWNLEKTKGTFLFWHASGDFRAASLWPEAEFLANQKVKIPFNKESIIEALQNRTIVPSVFTSLLTLLTFGVRPSGGYHQIAYLPEYSRRLAQFAEATKVSDCHIFQAKIHCADLIQLGYGFTFLPDASSETGQAGIDSLICSPIESDFFNEKMHSVTVLESVLANSQRWYNEIVPVNKRN